MATWRCPQQFPSIQPVASGEVTERNQRPIVKTTMSSLQIL
jgi:hypothetical protein